MCTGDVEPRWTQTLLGECYLLMPNRFHFSQNFEHSLTSRIPIELGKISKTSSGTCKYVVFWSAFHRPPMTMTTAGERISVSPCVSYYHSLRNLSSNRCVCVCVCTF